MTVKHDKGKPRPTLLPLKELNQVIEVLEFGAQKYAVDNWQTVPDARQRYTDALLRHSIAYANGEILDDESELHHLAHAACCALFIMWFDNKGE
jgi:hypothetical protein